MIHLNRPPTHLGGWSKRLTVSSSPTSASPAIEFQSCCQSSHAEPPIQWPSDRALLQVYHIEYSSCTHTLSRSSDRRMISTPISAKETPDLGSQRVVLASAAAAPKAYYGQASKVELQLRAGKSKNEGRGGEGGLKKGGRKKCRYHPMPPFSHALLSLCGITGAKYTCICIVSARSCQVGQADSSAEDVAAVTAAVDGAPAAAAAVAAASSPPTPPAAAVDPSVECCSSRDVAVCGDAYEAVVSALVHPSAAPLRASLRLLPSPPVAASRAVVVFSSGSGGADSAPAGPPDAAVASAAAAWVPERLQQRLVEVGCRVHFGGGASCLVVALEPPAPSAPNARAGGSTSSTTSGTSSSTSSAVVHRIVRSTQVLVAGTEEQAKELLQKSSAQAAAQPVPPPSSLSSPAGRRASSAAGAGRGSPVAAASRGRGRASGAGSSGNRPARRQQESSSSSSSDSDSSPVAAATSAFALLGALGDDD